MADNQKQHALYSASSSHGWMTCAGMKAMEDGIPDEASRYADEGSAAHFLAAECLSFNQEPSEFLGRTIVCWVQEDGKSGQSFSSAPVPDKARETSRWEVTRDMVENLEVYVNLVRGHAKDGQLFIEQRVHFGELIGLSDQYGTSDAFILKNDGEEIVNLDLKYGHMSVHAENNPQLLLYDIGILADFKDAIDPEKLQRFRNIIAQPRINNISETVVPINDLLEFAEKARTAIQRAEEARVFFDTPNMLYETAREWQDEYLRPSEEGCRWCKAKRGAANRPICPAFEREALTDMMIPEATVEGLVDLDDQLDNAIQQVYNLPFDRVAKLFGAVGKLEQLIDVVQTRMLHDMMTGHKHPGWKIVKGRDGNRKWQDVEAAEKILKASHKVTAGEMYDRQLISPTSCEKLIKKDYPRVWGKLEPLIVRSEGKLLVAPMSDKREPLDPYGAAISALPDLTKAEILAEITELVAAELSVEVSIDDLL